MDSLEPRVAKLEAAVEHIEQEITEVRGDVGELRGEMAAEFRAVRANMRTDFRILFDALIAATLGLAGLTAHGFHWL